MKEVLPAVLERPGLVAGLIAIAFVICVVLYVLTAALFVRAGRRNALSFALMTSQRNLGLIVAGVGGVLPDVAWLYVALAQFPIYMAPYLLRPFSRGLHDR
jgi:BASS family bile acid:Na+ symporter